MGGRNIAPAPRGEWAPTPRERPSEKPKRCCAKCRRGVPGFGDLPCGYGKTDCPNDCHGVRGNLARLQQNLNTTKENQA